MFSLVVCQTLKIVDRQGASSLVSDLSAMLVGLCLCISVEMYSYCFCHIVTPLRCPRWRLQRRDVGMTPRRCFYEFL